MAECFDCGATPAPIVGEDGNNYCQRCWNGAPPSRPPATRVNYGPDTKKLLDKIQANGSRSQLRLYQLKVTTLPPLPETVTELSLIDLKKLQRISSFPPRLTSLSLYTIPPIHLPPFPPTLQTLFIQDMNVTTLPPLPNGLIELICSDNKQLTTLSQLPNTLKVLKCQNNPSLTSLPPLPPTLQVLNCANTKITLLPPLPEGLVSLDFTNTPLEELPLVPSSLASFRNMCKKLAPNPKRLKHYDELVRRLNIRNVDIADRDDEDEEEPNQDGMEVAIQNAIQHIQFVQQHGHPPQPVPEYIQPRPFRIWTGHLTLEKYNGVVNKLKEYREFLSRAQDYANVRHVTRNQGIPQLPEHLSSDILTQYVSGTQRTPTLQDINKKEFKLRARELLSRNGPIGVGGRRKTMRKRRSSRKIKNY